MQCVCFRELEATKEESDERNEVIGRIFKALDDLNPPALERA
jgi:hypothetical protein